MQTYTKINLCILHSIPVGVRFTTTKTQFKHTHLNQNLHKKQSNTCDK